MQTVHNASPTGRVIIGSWVYDLAQITAIHTISDSANGRPNEVEVLTPQGIHTLYDEEAMVMWSFYTLEATDTAESLARYKQEIEDIIVAEAQALGQVDQDQQQPQATRYTYVYTPEDVQTYLDVSRALDRADHNVITLAQYGLVKPDDLRTWCIIAQALENASFYIAITDWDANSVEVHRLPGETPHGHWKKWMDDEEATHLIAETITDVERQKAND